MPSRIIVLGMFRSGTSLNARLVQRWGAYAGTEQDLFSDQYGYMEHLGLQKLNDELMDHNDRVPPPTSLLVQRAAEASFREPAERLLELMDRQAEQSHQPAWVWKDPRLPMLIPFWSRIWDDVIYVITVRHPLEIIQSAAQMDGVTANSIALAAGLVFWQHNMLNVLSETRLSRRKIFMAFDQLTGDPAGECSRLCRFLDAHCGTHTSPEDLVSQVDAAHRHYIEPRPLSEVEQATREQRALYDFLRVKVHYPDETFIESDFAPNPGALDFLRAMDLLVAMSREGEEGETAR